MAVTRPVEVRLPGEDVTSPDPGGAAMGSGPNSFHSVPLSGMFTDGAFRSSNRSRCNGLSRPHSRGFERRRVRVFRPECGLAVGMEGFTWGGRRFKSLSVGRASQAHG